MTEPQKVDIRLYLGWSTRFYQTDSRLEQAMRAVDSDPDTEALLTNSLTADPVGIIASIKDIDAKISASHDRLKAAAVGSITLNSRELNQLRSEGRRHTGRLASIMGVEVRHDVFSGTGPTKFASYDGMSGTGNYVGK